MQNIATSLENWHLPKKLSSHLPYDLGILPLGIYTGDIKAYVHAKTYTQKFIAALFVTVPNWKQSKYPTKGEEINTLWHIYTMKSALQVNSLLLSHSGSLNKILLLSLQSCPTLCDPIDGSPPGSPVPGILQARTLEWVAISFSNAWVKSEREVPQSCPTLSDPMDCSPPGSSIHGIFQARVLEWGAIAFSSIKYYWVLNKNEPMLYTCNNMMNPGFF